MLGKAFVEGMSHYIPFSSFESRLFLARRLAGVPGYQYDVDISREGLYKQIFSASEIELFKQKFQSTTGNEYRKHFVFDEKIYLLKVNSNPILENSQGSKIEECSKWRGDKKFLSTLLDLKPTQMLVMSHVDETMLSKYLNGDNLHELSKRDILKVQFEIAVVKLMRFRLFRLAVETYMRVSYFFMNRRHNLNLQNKLKSRCQ